jgi:hypothetical protein
MCARVIEGRSEATGAKTVSILLSHTGERQQRAVVVFVALEGRDIPIRACRCDHLSGRDDVCVVFKRCQNGVRMVSDWYQNGVRMLSHWCQNGLGIVSDWYKNGVRIVSEWCQNDVRKLLEWCHRRFSRDRPGLRRISLVGPWEENADM